MTHVTIDKPVLGQYNVMNYNKSPKEKVARTTQLVICRHCNKAFEWGSWSHHSLGISNEELTRHSLFYKRPLIIYGTHHHLSPGPIINVPVPRLHDSCTCTPFSLPFPFFYYHTLTCH